MESEVVIAVEKVLSEFEPYIAAHGGAIEFMGFEHPFVRLKLRGACSHCPISSVTLKLGIQKKLREHWPDIEVMAEDWQE